ncbi:hypothetical protein BS47DRAFT_1391232 [Hydnum rufescens UP504]|uniref:Hyaluronan/mRNA-binding protein domain-containing protein n=1 Tax=Hydnum rufescens UP504 TaxID=1448309 RepID=A0A9P6B2S4_9AGAM|nr:hypothetical protein BS47DRAFT_1391232 [Hydnum rufescens UP504]
MGNEVLDAWGTLNLRPLAVLSVFYGLDISSKGGSTGCVPHPKWSNPGAVETACVVGRRVITHDLGMIPCFQLPNQVTTHIASLYPSPTTLSVSSTSMTRTARAIYPRALTRDRSESKSGLDKSLSKHGAGNHNWGSLQDETHQVEDAVEYYSADEYADTASTVESSSTQGDDASKAQPQNNAPQQQQKRRASISITDADRASARSFRTRSFKDRPDIDLTAIARTSFAVSTSPTSPTDSFLRNSAVSIPTTSTFHPDLIIVQQPTTDSSQAQCLIIPKEHNFLKRKPKYSKSSPAPLLKLKESIWPHGPVFLYNCPFSPESGPYPPWPSYLSDPPSPSPLLSIPTEIPQFMQSRSIASPPHDWPNEKPVASRTRLTPPESPRFPREGPVGLIFKRKFQARLASQSEAGILHKSLSRSEGCIRGPGDGSFGCEACQWSSNMAELSPGVEPERDP